MTPHATHASRLFHLTTNRPPNPLQSLLQTLTPSDGIAVLGRDGVLRNLNKGRDTVVDYIQLSKAQVAEFTARCMPDAKELYHDV